MHVLTIGVKAPPMSLNQQRRAHWTRVREAKQEVEWLVKAAVAKEKLGTVGPCEVEFIWYAPDARVRDADALSPFVKGALDSLVRCGVLPVDDWRHVLGITTRVIVDRANPRIEIRLRESQQIA